MGVVTAAQARDWLIEKIAHRLDVATSAISTDQFFDEFGLDSTEGLLLAGELEAWLGFEINATAFWYHPTIAELAQYLAEECDNHAAQA